MAEVQIQKSSDVFPLREATAKIRNLKISAATPETVLNYDRKKKRMQSYIIFVIFSNIELFVHHCFIAGM